MSAVSVTSKGQVTIPVDVRRALGIEPGTKVTFTAKNGVAHLQVEKQHRHATIADGAGLIAVKVKGKARSLLTFDAASLVRRAK